MLHSQLGDFADVVVALLVTETSETQGGLTAATVLLGKVDGELVDDLAGVASNGTEKSAVTVHDNETEFGVGLKQLLQRLGVELVVAKVKRAATQDEQNDTGKLRGFAYVLIGLWGSKSNDTFFSFPSSVRMVPTKSTRPFGGTRL